MASESVNFCRKTRTVHTKLRARFLEERTSSEWVCCPLELLDGSCFNVRQHTEVEVEKRSHRIKVTRSKCVVIRLPGVLPAVFERNLQCELVRKMDTRDECHWAHACSLQANMRVIQWHPRV
jgi:hypothetical protein